MTSKKLASTRAYPSHKDIAAKVVLPPGERISHLFKIAPKGHPPKPTITSISPSCRYEQLEVGQIICAVGIKDEFILDPSAKFLHDVINEFNFSDERTLLLQRSPNHLSAHGNMRNGQRQQQQHGRHHQQHHHHNHSHKNQARSKSAREVQVRSSSTRQLHNARSRSANQLQARSSSTKRLHAPSSRKQQSVRKIGPVTRPGPGKISLPTGHAGLWLEGNPAILTDVSAGSPVANEARGKVGLAVTAMVIPGEIEVFGPISTDECVDLLNDFSDVEGRMIMFDRVQAATEVEEVVSKIHLPTKDVSIRFSGKHPNIKVSKVDGNSLTARKVKVGQIVHRLEFPGEAPYFSSVGAKTLNVLLEHHEKTRGKVLVVGYPFKLNDEKAFEMDEVEKTTFSAQDIRRSFHEWKSQNARR